MAVPILWRSSLSSFFLALLTFSCVVRIDPVHATQNDGEHAVSVFEELTKAFRSLRSADYGVTVEQNDGSGWRVVTRCRIQQDGLRLRCEYSGTHMTAITIVGPVDLDVAAASFQQRPGNPNAGQLKVMPTFCVGDGVVGRNGFAIVSNAVILSVFGSDPAYDKVRFKPGADPTDVVLEEFSNGFRTEGQTWVSDGQADGQPCRIISFVHQNSPERTVRWFVGGSPLRMLRRENEYSDKSKIWFVSEWHDLSTTAGLAIPRQVEWYTLKDGRRSEEGRMIVSELKVNGTVPELCFRVRDIEGLKPGQPVSFSDSRPYPCAVTEQLLWDGQKLVCGSLDGVAAMLEARSKRNWLRTAAIWCASLGGLAGCWILAKVGARRLAQRRAGGSGLGVTGE